MKTLFTLAAAAIILAACTNDNETVTTPDGTPVALNVSSGIAAHDQALATTWQPGDAIGIYMLEAATEKAANRKYTNTTGDNFAPAADNQTIYFPVNNDAPKVDFVAYHPFAPAQSGLTYAIDLATQTNQPALDLLTADKVTGRDKTNPNVAFTFRHRLVKMELTMRPGTGVETADLAGLKVDITSQHTTATCDLATGAVTPSGDAKPITLATTTEGTFAEATLLPATATAGKEILFTLSTGDVFRYTIPVDRAFNPGEKHSYEITLNRTGVGVTATIANWTGVPGSGIAD